jgi:two-component system sensor histidine kinase AlgZ
MESKSGFMKDTQILSAFQELAPATDAGASRWRCCAGGPVFDACQIGVVLRAVLFVEVCACRWGGIR